MKKLKVIIAVLMCSVIIIVGSVPASALVGELTLGTGALLGIVITGLMASGVVISSNNNGGIEGAAQGIYNAMTPQMQEAIAALKVTEIYGQHFVHWTSSVWHDFTNFVNQYFTTSGASTIPQQGSLIYDASYFSSPYFVFPFTLASSGLYSSGNLSFNYDGNYESNFRRFVTVINYSINSSLYSDSVSFRNERADYLYVNGKDFILSLPFWTGSSLAISTGRYAFPISDLLINDVLYECLWQSSSHSVLLRTENAPYTEYIVTSEYASIADWLLDVMVCGHFIGYLPNSLEYIPAVPELEEGIEVEVFPNDYVGTGSESLPDVIPDGTSIAIPLPGSIVDGDTVIIPDIPGTLTDTIPQDIIKDVTIDTAIPDVAYPDMPELPDDGSEDSPDDKANKMRFPAVAKEKFPFCIPFDFFNAIQMLSAPAQIPEYDIPFVVPSINFRYNVHLDFSDFETVVKVLRWFLSAGWILTLILITKSIIK